MFNKSRIVLISAATELYSVKFLLGCLIPMLVACSSTPSTEQKSKFGESTSNFSDKWSQQDIDETEVIADMHYDNGELDQALYLYLRALETNPNSAVLYYKIGRVHRRASKPKLAALAFAQAVELEPDNIQILQAAGQLALSERNIVAATEYLTKSVLIDKRRFDGDNEPELDQKSPYKAYIGLGLIADLKGDHPRAKGYFGTASLIRPELPEIANNIGYSWYLSGRWNKAEQYFQRALDLDSHYELARHNLALLYVRTERTEKALAILWEDNNQPSTYNTLGYLCMLNSKYVEAEKYFQLAIDASPVYHSLANVNLNRARALNRPKHQLFSP
ncbi:MAG: tetratricopeptide repeat protein [Pseudomonadales bacterium]